MADGNFGNVNASGYISAAGNVTGGRIRSSSTVSAVGNITGSYFFGNGSQLTGIYSNANVAAYLPTYNGNISVGNINISGVETGAAILGANLVSTNYAVIGINKNNALSVSGNILVGGAGNGAISAAGNIRTSGYFVGDGSRLTNLNVANLTTVGSLTVASVATANYFVGDGSRLSNISTTSANTAVRVTGNAQPNITSLGTLANLSVSGTTTTYNLNASGLINTAGNVQGRYLLGNGAFLTGLASSVAPSRVSISVTTDYLAANASTNLTATGFKGYALYSIQTTSPAWITVYSSYSARSLDAGRAIGTDPTPGKGIIAELIATTPVTQLFTPAVLGFSSEVPPSTDIPLRIVNNTSGIAQPITVTLTLVKTES